jgi:RNA polymerase sigma-70 factor (ECF subfamily)
MEAALPSEHPLPEDSVQAGEQTLRLRQGLQSLSPEHRAALELVFYQDLSLAEAAGVCGCPVGTLKSRLSYARQYLRAHLTNRKGEDWR